MREYSLWNTIKKNNKNNNKNKNNSLMKWQNIQNHLKKIIVKRQIKIIKN